MSQGSQVAGFSTDYLIDLVTRFINWQMIGAIFVLLVAWLFLSQWIRITVFVVAILLWLNVLTLAGPSFSLWPAGQPTTTVTTTGGNAAATVAATGGAPVVGLGPFLFYSWPGYSCHNGFALPFLWLPFCYG